MINEEYVNDSIVIDNTLIDEYESFSESCKNEINEMFANFDIIHEKVMLESAIMDRVPDQMMMVYESEKKNIFAKIGEVIIEMFRKIGKFIDGIIGKFKDLSFKKKSVEQKLEIIKKDPKLNSELKKAVEEAAKSGALDLRDISSIKEIEKAIEEIEKMARQKDIDTKTLRGKFEKLKDRFNDDSKSWKIVKVGAAVGAAAVITSFVPNLVKHVDDLKNRKSENKEKQAELLAEIDQYRKETVTDKKTGNTEEKEFGFFRLRLEMRRWADQLYTQVMNHNYTTMGRILNFLANTADKLIKNDNHYVDNLKEINKRKDEKAKNEREAELSKAEEETRRRKEAELKHREDNEDRYANLERNSYANKKVIDNLYNKK